MKINKLFKDEIFLSYFFVIFFSLIFFFNIQNPYESFYVNYDQEFWNTYNSLLIYSNMEQEKYDEPGHISYLLFSFYLKIIDLLNILQVPDINDFNNLDNIKNKTQSLVFQSRIFGLLLNTILTLFIIKIFKKFGAKNLILFTFILITSNGFLTHVSQYRVEPLTLLLLIISMFILMSLIDSNKYQNLKIFFFNFFIILSIINKVQIIFYMPLMLLIILHYKKFNFCLIKNIKFLIKNKRDLLYFLISTFLIISLISIRSEQLHSTAYLVIIYLFFLISFFSLIEINYYKNISIFFNLTLLLSFLVIYNLVINFTNGGERTFWVFFKISKIRGYLGDIKLDQSYDTILWIKEFILFGIHNLKELLLSIFEIKKNSLIILAVFGLTIASKKFKEYYHLNIFIILYLTIKFITLFRSNAFYYEIYFDWFILLGLVIFLNNFKIKKIFNYTMLSTILILNIYNNFNTKNFQQINGGSYSKETYCSKEQIYSVNGIWEYYSKKIKKEQIIYLCK